MSDLQRKFAGLNGDSACWTRELYIRRAWSGENSVGGLAAKVRHEPEEEGEDEAKKEAGDDGEIKGRMFAAMDDIAGKFTEAEGEISAEIKQRADDREERSEDEKDAAKFAKRIHDNIIEESQPPSATE
ncbi:MAG: hypothetical protein WA765_01730 [Candidatus Acidiferrum sp.]